MGEEKKGTSMYHYQKHNCRRVTGSVQAFFLVWWSRRAEEELRGRATFSPHEITYWHTSRCASCYFLVESCKVPISVCIFKAIMHSRLHEQGCFILACPSPRSIHICLCLSLQAPRFLKSRNILYLCASTSCHLSLLQGQLHITGKLRKVRKKCGR